LFVHFPLRISLQRESPCNVLKISGAASPSTNTGLSEALLRTNNEPAKILDPEIGSWMNWVRVDFLKTVIEFV
jgi:hypothetical protein